MERNNQLKFYKVDVEYCNYLRSFDSKVPYIEYSKHNKFFVGVVFELFNIKYFAPLSSYNIKDVNAFNVKKDGQILSSIRLNYMFPVIDGVYQTLMIKEESDVKYKKLLQYEYEYCNNHRSEIRQLAENTYLKRMKAESNLKQREFFDRFVINFRILEKVCNKYRKKQS